MSNMEAIILFFTIIGIIFLFNFITKQIEKKQNQRIEEHKKIYPEL